MALRLTCNQKLAGSIPVSGFRYHSKQRVRRIARPSTRDF